MATDSKSAPVNGSWLAAKRRVANSGLPGVPPARRGQCGGQGTRTHFEPDRLSPAGQLIGTHLEPDRFSPAGQLIGTHLEPDSFSPAGQLIGTQFGAVPVVPAGHGVGTQLGGVPVVPAGQVGWATAWDSEAAVVARSTEVPPALTAKIASASRTP